MAKDDEFLQALDVAAKLLLEKAGVSAKVEDGTSPPVALADRVKAFEAVVDWAKTRRGLAPQEKPKSAFDAITSQFKGEPAVGRRSPRRAKKDAGGDPATPVEPADAEPADLFGSDEA